MKIGIIGYGSMGKMLLRKFSEKKNISKDDLFAANRTAAKLDEAADIVTICGSNGELACKADIVFVCVRPADIRVVLEEIKGAVKENTLIVSLNGSIQFSLMENIINHKMAKVIPSVTAEIDQSQTLVCFNDKVAESDKETLKELLTCIGTVRELTEDKMGMGSELVSCMPGFIASIFDVICRSAGKHVDFPPEMIVEMVLNTMKATGNLMLEKGMSFEDVVTRVATKGGITQEGTKVIYEMFPEAADELFEKTLEKRRIVAEQANNSWK
ncbi:MAG: NAD(P)-binding domain-containing protein [Eubacterium sp.]|nr:NAD(P)-binding domain-containing protein [Eubacterium sp.]